MAFFYFSQPTTDGSTADKAILEEGGNINGALQIAQNSRGPSIEGEPAAIYGKIMKYEDAVKGFGSLVVALGESQAWKFDRPVHVYLFEGDFTSTKIGTSQVSDWVQTILIIDAETGTLMQRTTHRLAGKIDTSQFLTLEVRESIKGVPARDVTSLDRPVEVPVAAATPAPRDAQSR
ncbi:MAG: hypothetical protein IH872_10720 [Chloroflexi bacterium]|nr:hypothetical protein [Chloroflexota bacterium]